MAIVHLDNVAVGTQLSILSHPYVILPGVFGEAPLEALQNFLPPRKLEFASPDGLHHVWLSRIFSPHRQQDLSNVNAGCHANRLAVRMPHPTREPICSRATKHLVGPDDMVGVDPYTDVVPVLAYGVGEVLVDSNTAGLQGLAGDLLLLVANKVTDEGKEVNRSFLRADVVDLDL